MSRAVRNNTGIGQIHWQTPTIANGVVYISDNGRQLTGFGTIGSMAPPPEVISPLGGIFTGVTGGASYFSGACAPGPTSAAPEHMFAWTPNATGPATIASCSPNTKFDTVIYVSTNMDASSPLQCVDDTPGCAVADGSARAGTHGSIVNMNVTAGTTYYVVVDSYAGSSGAPSGQYQVTITPPSGSTSPDGGAGGTAGTPDAGSDTGSTGAAGTGAAGTGAGGTAGMSGLPSIPVSTTAPVTVSGTTTGASTHSGTCAAGGSAAAPDVTYQFTPTKTGSWTFQTCSPMTKFDTVLYVRTGNTTGTELACADDTIGCATGDGSIYSDRHGSQFNLTLTAGVTYYVVVDGYSPSTGGSSGNYLLTVTPPP